MRPAPAGVLVRYPVYLDCTCPVPSFRRSTELSRDRGGGGEWKRNGDRIKERCFVTGGFKLRNGNSLPHECRSQYLVRG